MHREASKRAYAWKAAAPSITIAPRGGVPHRRCGKLVVATNKDEDAALLELYERALSNGLEDMELIEAARLKELEPYVAGVSALLSKVGQPCSYGHR